MPSSRPFHDLLFLALVNLEIFVYRTRGGLGDDILVPCPRTASDSDTSALPASTGCRLAHKKTEQAGPHYEAASKLKDVPRLPSRDLV